MRKNGVEIPCATCGSPVYVPPWRQKDCTQGGPYCSRPCKHAAQKGRPQLWHDPAHKVRHSAGYVLIWKPDHPRAVRGRILEHIVVMEEKLCRPLGPFERVHHVDHDKTNNSPENLELFASDSEHAIHHSKERFGPGFVGTKVRMTCHECGSSYMKAASRSSESKYCSGSCRSRAVSRRRWQAQKGD